MEEENHSEIAEFNRLMSAIQAESTSLKKVILTEDEATEKAKILSEFDGTVQVQVFGTLNHLIQYQMNGWKELINDEEDGDDR